MTSFAPKYNTYCCTSYLQKPLSVKKEKVSLNKALNFSLHTSVQVYCKSFWIEKSAK